MTRRDAPSGATPSRSPLSRRAFLAGTTGGAALALAGCSMGTKQMFTGGTSGTTIAVAIVSNSQMQDAISLSHLFESEHPDIHLDFISLPENEARAKITCRIVPDQDPDEVVTLVVRHLERHVPPGARLTITPGEDRARPASIARNHPVLKTAAAALQDTYGVAPLFVRMGGTVPVAEIFQRLLGLDTVYFSFSTGDEDFHAPNEFFRVHRLHEGLAAWARLLERLGR